MEDTIRTYLTSVLRVRFGVGPRPVDERTNLLEAGHVDSFSFIQLLAFLESEFRIKITDGEALSDSMSSLAGMCALVRTKVDARG